MVSVKDFNPKPGKPEDLAPGLRRLLAPNPSPMTFRGTNTYLLGTRDIAVIDPGPPDDAHLQAIFDSLTAAQRISHVIVTHSHVDHSPLAMVLAQISGAKVHAFGDSRAGVSRSPLSRSDIGGGEGVDETFMPDVFVPHGGEISGSDWSLIAHHTPGHMGNHLSYEWREGRALFSGDVVMGWATSMVSPPDGDISDFMASLEYLANLEGCDAYYPGHAAPISDPKARVAELAAHRKSREAEILAQLAAGPATPDAMTREIYVDVDPALWPAAQRNVMAHLIDLTQRKIASPQGEFSQHATFQLV